jgi:hypothetical protein
VLRVSLIAELHEEKVLQEHQWNRLWTAITDTTGGTIQGHWIPQTLQKLSPVAFGSPKIVLIPAIRKIDPTGGDESDFSGLGLIAKLSRLQHPPYNSQDLRERFDQITEFV